MLALDIGTSSTRALLYDVETCVAVPNASYSLSHEPAVTPDGGATLDPAELVEEALRCAEVTLAHAPEWEVVGVAVCTFWHSFVGVGADGRPRTPILLWSDRRSAPQVARLRELLDPAEYSQRTGCPLHTSFLPGRLQWLYEYDPELFGLSRRFLSPGEYLFAVLFGQERVTCSVSMASATGLWDAHRAAWDGETLSLLPGVTPDQFSRVSDMPVSGLREPYRERLPQLADVPWFPALGDGACSNIGCGAATPDRIALMIGTSAALRVTLPQTDPPVVPAGLWRYQASEGRYVVGGALSNGGSVWAWLRRTLYFEGMASDDAIEAAMGSLPPDGHGLTVLPFFSGERAPLWRDDLTATVYGLTAATTSLEIARAHLEAVALRLAALREAMRAVAPEVEIIGTGGALLNSPAWVQMIADALGEPISLSREEEASSRGAILLARERLGGGKVEDAPPVEEIAQARPVARHTGIYAGASRRQQELLELLLNLS